MCIILSYRSKTYIEMQEFIQYRIFNEVYFKIMLIFFYDNGIAHHV